MFYGVLVRMYMRDDKQHHLPHIHVQYAEHTAVYTIPDGELLEGSLPKKQQRLLQAWVELHEDELMADWALAVAGETPYKISPLA
jgi:Domain of unknown function (DUF4160)